MSTKLSKAQTKMLQRLTNTKDRIGYMRFWYHLASDGEYRCYGSKAHNETLEVLLRLGLVTEIGTPNKVGYRIEVVQE